MLLYARTTEELQPDCAFEMSGNTISVRTLDLHQDFSAIANVLNTIVGEHFENVRQEGEYAVSACAGEFYRA